VRARALARCEVKAAHRIAKRRRLRCRRTVRRLLVGRWHATKPTSRHRFRAALLLRPFPLIRDHSFASSGPRSRTIAEQEVGMQIECYLHQTGHSRSLGLRIQRPWHLRRVRVHGRLRRARLVRRRRQRRAVDEWRLAPRRAVVCVERPLASAPAQDEQKRERGQREHDHATERDARDRSATDGMPGAEAGQQTRRGGAEKGVPLTRRAAGRSTRARRRSRCRRTRSVLCSLLRVYAGRPGGRRTCRATSVGGRPVPTH
jgi:hypothetical protein